MNIGTIIDAWLDTYRAAGRSPGTIRARGSYVRTAARSIDLLTVDADGLLAYCAGRHLSPEGRKSMIVALRSFYRWAYRRGLIAVDLAAELPAVTVPRTEVEPVPIAVLTRARAIADAPTLLALDLGALMGLRRSEIAAVHRDDVSDFGLRVLGKGSRLRVVPIHPRLRARLDALDGWAFPGRFGGHCSGDHIGDLVARVMPGYSCHALRHYFATTVYRKTHDLRSLQKLLGHASIETTQRYVFTDQEAMDAAVRAVA